MEYHIESRESKVSVRYILKAILVELADRFAVRLVNREETLHWKFNVSI